MLVTVTAVVGLLPYFALQLKAITISFEALAGDAAEGAVGRLPGGTTLLVAAAMAAFAVLFGVRSVNANEPHRGLMLAVATELVVKLAAALVVGGAVAFFAFDAPRGLVEAVRGDPELARLLAFDAARPGLVGDLRCSPRSPSSACRGSSTSPSSRTPTSDDVRTAAWAFPLYLVAINLFVLPVAMVGLTLFPGGAVQPDTFMVAIPRELGWSVARLRRLPRRALGGDRHDHRRDPRARHHGSATTSSCRCSRAIRGLRERWEANPAPALLAGAPAWRWSAIMALAYGCYLVIGPAFPLAAIGLISFAAVAQFAPALLGGMFWRGATAAGAFAGIGAGFLGWV